jgi:hypothetical protein
MTPTLTGHPAPTFYDLIRENLKAAYLFVYPGLAADAAVIVVDTALTRARIRYLDFDSLLQAIWLATATFFPVLTTATLDDCIDGFYAVAKHAPFLAAARTPGLSNGASAPLVSAAIQKPSETVQ